MSISEIDAGTAGKIVVWLAAGGAVAWALVRTIVQPVLTAWLFLTLKNEKARVREVVAAAFSDEIAEATKALREVRDELSKLSGYVERMGEERK